MLCSSQSATFSWPELEEAGVAARIPLPNTEDGTRAAQAAPSVVYVRVNC
jgi:hypothetical protein